MALLRDQDNVSKGMLLGLIGVVTFSLTLPMTRLIIPYFDPIFIGLGRSVIAAFIAIILIVFLKAAIPNRGEFKQLLLTAIGVIAGFPIFISFGMQTVPASHGSVVIGLLPLLTAVFAVLISHERPSIGFWVAAFVGALLVVIYSLLQGGMELHRGDIYLVIASVLGAWGYAVGGKLSKDMGGWQVICWVNIVGLPFSLVGGIWLMPDDLSLIPLDGWLGLFYLALASQLFGFFFWYRGLAIGGIARVSQTQLLQPFLSIFASIIILGEEVGISTYIFAVAVVIAIAFTRKMSVKQLDVVKE